MYGTYGTYGSASQQDAQALRNRMAPFAHHTESNCWPSTIQGHVYFSICVQMSRLGAMCDVGPVIGAWYEEVGARDPNVFVASDCLMCSMLAADEAREASRQLAATDRKSLQLPLTDASIISTARG